MLLSEAARSERRFRRACEPDRWYWLEGRQIFANVLPGDAIRTPNGTTGKTPVCITAEQLVATNWEPEPKEIKITVADLYGVARALSNHPITNQRRLSPMEFMKLVAEELGLEEKTG